MKNSISLYLVRFSWLVLGAWLISACQPDNVGEQTAQEKKKQSEEAAKENSQFIVAAHDAMDMTAAAMVDQGINGGRYSPDGKIEGHHMGCAVTISTAFTANKSNPDSIVYSGSLTIDFGDGSTCKDSTDIRKGKIKDSFLLVITHRKNYNLTESISFEGFQKDSVGIDGTFTSKTISHATSTLTVEQLKMTYADGTFATWDGSLTSTYYRGENEWSKEDDAKDITGSFHGVSRSGTAFSALVTNAIFFKYSCSRKFPVSGTVDLTVGGVDSTIDYGAGTCDKIYTIATGGTTTELKFPGKPV